jgi:DNA-binding XRE family transcriptional regulator
MSLNVLPDITKIPRTQVARIVKESRLKKSLTQKELAELAGISLRSLQRIENGKVLPRAYTWRQLTAHIDLMTTAPAPEVIKPGTARKWILTVSSLVVLVLAFSAFVIQSPTFPETLFETLNMLLVGFMLYAAILYRIWR